MFNTKITPMKIEKWKHLINVGFFPYNVHKKSFKCKHYALWINNKNIWYISLIKHTYNSQSARQ